MLFALAFALTARTGLGGAGALVYFVALLSALLLLFTLVLYPVETLVGGAPARPFVRALIPA